MLSGRVEQGNSRPHRSVLQGDGVQRGKLCRVRDGGGKSAAAGVVGGGFRALVGAVVTIIVFLTPAGGA
jgi:hypothetical protein